MNQGDTLVVTIDGSEVGRATIPIDMSDYVANRTSTTLTVNLSATEIAKALAPKMVDVLPREVKAPPSADSAS